MSHTYTVIACNKAGQCEDIVLVTENYMQAQLATVKMRKKVCECCESVKVRTLYIIGGTARIGEQILKL